MAIEFKPLSTEGFICSDAAQLCEGKVMAFVAVVTGYGVGLGLAEANKPGYHPIPFHWCRSDDFDQMHQHADAMNLEHFELSPEQASDIVVTTMRLGS